MSRTDRLEQDLERGFEALEEGRIDDAAASLERCKRIDRKNPNVIGLAAAVADARGDIDEALAQWRALSELHPDDAPPRLAIARLELHDVGDPEAALATLAATFELIDEETDLIDAVMLKTEALLMTDDLEGAKATLKELASSAIDDPSLALDLAELALSAEDGEVATRWVATARALPLPEDAEPGAKEAIEADALHLIGRIHELDGERDQMLAAWQQVRILDAAAPAGEVTITEDELEKIAMETLAELPEKVRDKLQRVPILIDDLPSEALVADGLDPRLLGVFQGISMPDDGELAPSVTNIVLFRKNLERCSADVEELAEQVRITVLHETAHYFGLDEEDLEELGLD